MKRYAKDKTPRIKPVKNIELSEKHIKLRAIIAIIFLIIAVCAVGYGVHSCLSAEKGLQEISADLSAGYSLAGNFKFMYDVGGTGKNATAERKTLVGIYTKAGKDAYNMFDNYAPDGYLKKINESIDKDPVEVPAELYSALKMMVDYGGRMLYYTPYFEYYEQIFMASDDYYAALYDPEENPALKDLFSYLSVYINDDNAIKLEFLDNNSVRLVLSDEYRDFLQEHEITDLIGFGWLENAFAADYISDIMLKSGYSNGYLVSIDGFTEYMNGRGYDYNAVLYDRVDNEVGPVCRIVFDRAKSSVLFYSNYEISSDGNSYMYSDGRVVTPFTDENGEQKCAVNTLFLYSKSCGCAETALKAASIFIADDIDDEKLKSLQNDETYAAYLQDGKLKYTEEELVIDDISEIYKAEYIK